MMLVAHSSDFLIKYNLHVGYSGYYQSKLFSQVYTLFDLVGSPGTTSERLLLLTGSQKEVPQEDDAIEGEANEEPPCLVEVVNEESGTIVLKLVP